MQRLAAAYVAQLFPVETVAADTDWSLLLVAAYSGFRVYNV